MKVSFTLLACLCAVYAIQGKPISTTSGASCTSKCEKNVKNPPCKNPVKPSVKGQSQSSQVSSSTCQTSNSPISVGKGGSPSNLLPSVSSVTNGLPLSVGAVSSATSGITQGGKGGILSFDDINNLLKKFPLVGQNGDVSVDSIAGLTKGLQQLLNNKGDSSSSGGFLPGVNLNGASNVGSLTNGLTNVGGLSSTAGIVAGLTGPAAGLTDPATGSTVGGLTSPATRSIDDPTELINNVLPTGSVGDSIESSPVGNNNAGLGNNPDLGDLTKNVGETDSPVGDISVPT